MGLMSTDGNGYRKELKSQLESQGQVVNMVGENSNGNMYDKQNEGWSGFTISEVQVKAEASLPKYLPSVVTVLVGTNDAKQAPDSQSDIEAGNTMHDHLDSMLATIYKHVPDAVVIVSKLPPNADPKAPKANDRINVYNARIPDLVNAWAIGEKSGGQKKPITWIDSQAIIGVHDLVDGTHPNDAAYSRLGVAWYNAILKMRTFLKQPEQISAVYRGVW